MWTYFGSNAAEIFKHASGLFIILTGACPSYALKLMGVSISIITSRFHQWERSIARSQLTGHIIGGHSRQDIASA